MWLKSSVNGCKHAEIFLRATFETKTCKFSVWKFSFFSFTSWQHPDSYFLTFQLGFGSFLGIIGAHLIENKRQMVRGFVLPLCIEITLTCPQSESTGIKSRLRPQPPPQSLIILLMWQWNYRAPPGCGCDPGGPVEAVNPNKSCGLQIGSVWK